MIHTTVLKFKILKRVQNSINILVCMYIYTVFVNGPQMYKANSQRLPLNKEGIGIPLPHQI